ARQTANAAATVGAIPGMGTPIDTLTAVLTSRTGAHPEDNLPVQVMSRPGYADNVTLLSGPDGAGAWVPDRYAKALGLKIGDTVDMSRSALRVSGYYDLPAPHSAIRVAAIYRDLRSEATRKWWCGVQPIIDPPGADFSNAVTPFLVLLEPATALDLYAATYAQPTHYLEYPIADPNLDLDQARTLSGKLSALATRLRANTTGQDPDLPDLAGRMTVTTNLPNFTRRADLTRSGMLPDVLPTTAVGALVGLLVVAAATVFWVQRRRRELTVLSAHGVAARALGVKAMLESFPALLIGAAAGWGLAWLLVARAGPDPVLSGEARPLSLAGAGLALAASILTCGVVAALASRSLTDTVRAHHRTVLGAIPWELLILAGAYPLWRALGDSRSTSDAAGGVGSVAHVPARLLVVPILVVAGLTALAARLAVLWLRRRRLRRSPAAVGAFLGWRRLGRQALMTALLAAAVAVPIARAAYGAAVTGSVRRTIEGEAQLRVGSDVVITLSEPVPVPAVWAGHATEVLRLNGTQVGGFHTDVLAVDPATFPQGAFWTGNLGPSLDTLMDRLRTPSAGATTLLATAPVPEGVQATSYAGSPAFGGQVDVQLLGALPAAQGGYPVALVAADTLGKQADYARPQLWIRGDPEVIRHQAESLNLPIQRLAVADALYANTLWEPLTYTFTYLTALSLLTGIVTVVGLLLYLEAQAPVHRRSYVLLRRMGMRARSHRRALLGEIGYPMIAGLVLGVGVAAGVTWYLRSDLEMTPGVPPATIVAGPAAPVGLITLAVLLAALGAASYAHRRISRARASEVLRDTVG
ncbi:MAG TPA: FtsX-like permease family protein, partial [Rugosimonospora sp.]|nr:FtsX-like permease family protein [Rugosimonospora sp.]